MATRAEIARQGKPPPPPPTNIEKAERADPSSFLGKIMRTLMENVRDLLRHNPDVKNNTGAILGEMFLWKEIEKYSKGRYDSLKKYAKAEKIIDIPDEEETDGLAPGDHIIGESRHFVVAAKVTEKVRRFSADVFAQGLFESYKIPVILTKEKIEKSKVPTKSQVKISIMERS